MKRAGFIVLLVALGAVTNVAVAWACWALQVFPGIRQSFAVPLSITTMPGAPSVRGAHVWEWERPGGFWQTPPAWARPTARRITQKDADGATLLVYGAGWPATTLTMHQFVANGQPGPSTLQWAVRIPWRWTRTSVLPTRPYVPGFALNTALYAVVWLGLLTAVGVGRGARRMRRGLCPGCAYDLRADFASGCPECGWRRGGAKGAAA